MKTVGIHRRLDHNNRITIPKEFCEILDFKVEEMLEIMVYNSKVIMIRKSEAKKIQKKNDMAEKIKGIEEEPAKILDAEEMENLMKLHKKIKGGLEK